MTRVGALWIGGLESYMNEEFLQLAMNQLGQDGVVSIKVMTNKFTGEPAGYGFINFDSDQRAILTMHRLGGKVIPNSNPPVRFKLNHNSTRLQPGEADTSIWVGDLTPDVDDYALYQFFSQRYQTVRCAKVVLDESGFSKGKYCVPLLHICLVLEAYNESDEILLPCRLRICTIWSRVRTTACLRKHDRRVGSRFQAYQSEHGKPEEQSHWNRRSGHGSH